MDFEGLGNNELVAGHHFDSGASFDSAALALIKSSEGGTGNFDNNPSGKTILYFLAETEATLTVNDGFCESFSFWYSSSHPGTVEVYGQGGNLLASMSLAATPNSYEKNDAWKQVAMEWDPNPAAKNQTAYSVKFIGLANYMGIDDIQFSSPTNGGGCDPHVWGVLGQSFYFTGGKGASPYYAFVHEDNLHLNVRAAAPSREEDPSFMDGVGLTLFAGTADEHKVAVLTPTEACLRRFSSSIECAAAAAEAAATARAAAALTAASNYSGMRGSLNRAGMLSPEEVLATVPCPGPAKVVVDGKVVGFGIRTLPGGIQVGVFEVPHFCKYHRAVFDQHHGMYDDSERAAEVARQRRASALQPTTCPARPAIAWYEHDTRVPEDWEAAEMRSWVMEGLQTASADLGRCAEWIKKPTTNLLEANMGGRLTTIIVKTAAQTVRVEHWAMGVAAAAAAMAAAAAAAAAEAAAATSPAAAAVAAAAAAAASSPGDAGAILDVFLYKWRAAHDSHGLLGGTSRFQKDDTGAPVMQGEGAFEGSIDDYEVPDLFSTSFKLRPARIS